MQIYYPEQIQDITKMTEAIREKDDAMADYYVNSIIERAYIEGKIK
jgi:hypothetical protein